MTTQAETVAPAAAAAASLKSPEKWKVLQMLPENIVVYYCDLV